MQVKLYNDDCLIAMSAMKDNSVDSIITDPPYGLSFMGKKWDYDVPSEEIWKECLRVLKPGGTALIFAGSRTQHRMAVRVEDSGFILKDTIMWVYGSGFPKAHDISKAMDKKAGAEREVVGENPNTRPAHKKGGAGFDKSVGVGEVDIQITAPSTPLAQQWDGWKGHGLKPAYEPILVCMKPNDKTYANNAEKWGVAGLNIEGSRVGTNGARTNSNGSNSMYGGNSLNTSITHNDTTIIHDKGRFPANLIHDGSPEVLEEFPVTGKASGAIRQNKLDSGANKYQGNNNITVDTYGHNDNGGSAARYFKQCDWAEEDVKQCIYIPKASKKEKNRGLENTEKGNIHATVKPISLMEYLCTLTKTPTGGIVLDPFMGSGSTGVASINTGRDFIGVEMSEEYFEICEARIEQAQKDNHNSLEKIMEFENAK